MFRDSAPMTAAEASAVILDGVRNDKWRILVGDDAVSLDQSVRADPEAAYDGMTLGALTSSTRTAAVRLPGVLIARRDRQAASSVIADAVRARVEPSRPP